MNIQRSDVLNTKFGRAKIDDKGYYRITTSKEGNHNKYLHRLIYEDNYGSILDGYHVHHDDDDKLNNCIMNLKLVSKSEHHSYHNKGKTHSEESCKKMSEVQIGNKKAFNSCIKIRKKKDKTCKQGFIWIARPYTKDKVISLSSVDLETCKQKVIDFIKSEKNTLGYTNYEIIGGE